MRPAATRPKSSRLSSPAVASLGPGDIAAKREDRDVSALQHFRAPNGLAPGPGYSHAVTGRGRWVATRSEEHTSELQSRLHLVCRLLLEKKKQTETSTIHLAASTPCTSPRAPL